MAIQALSTAASGMRGQQRNVDVIANNIANVNSTGYKRSRANFEDLFYRQVQRPTLTTPGGAASTTGVQIGLGTRLVSVQKVFEQGGFDVTDNPLDVAIEGDGFFRLNLGDRLGYTRDGALQVDQEGFIVSSDGFRLDPPINIPIESIQQSLFISRDGRVTIRNSGQAQEQELGEIQIFRFVNPAGLEAIGDNIYTETDASGPEIAGDPGSDGLGQLRHRALELSNVDIVREMVDLIKAQRAYEVNAKSIETADEMLQTANRLR